MSKKAGKSRADKAAQEGDVLNGTFINDFPLLCTQNGLPPVPVRVVPRPQAAQEEESSSAGAEDSATPPVRHAVLAEKDGEDMHAIKKLHVRGFLVDDRVMSALSSALEETQLTSLNFWNVGLTEEVQAKLVTMVSNSNIKRLVLDANAIFTNNIRELLSTTNLEQLSLKCCKLDDSFCADISSSLTANHTLTALDLGCNHLTDEGAGHLAGTLRLNRTLLSLGLSGNRIGDAGVHALCEVLLRFPLSREEERKRKLLLAQKEETSSSLQRSPSMLSLSGRASRGSSKGKKGDQKKEDKKKEDRGRKSSVASISAKAVKGKGGGRKVGKVEEEELPKGLDTSDGGEPLLELVEEEGGRLWLQGNTTLAHLTLSCNRVTVEGVRALTVVVRQQRAALTAPRPPSGTGLLRVPLEHNSLLADCPELSELAQLLESCDPLREPTAEGEDSETLT